MHPPDAPPPGATLLDGMLEDMLQRRYLVVDGHGRISRWSKGAERLLGWREEEVAGRSAFGPPLAWTGEGVELWKSYFDSPQSRRAPAHVNLMMLCRGGWGLCVDMTAVPVPLVLGYEFTMLVADLAVGGPGSQSEDRLVQVHPLAADAIASALRGDAPAVDSVAGMLVTLRAVGDAAVIEDPDAQHAARALVIERDAAQQDAPDPELPAADDDRTAEDLEEAQASLRAASAEVTRLREEIGRLRSQVGAEERAAQEARAEARAATAQSEALRAEAQAATARCEELTAALEAALREGDDARAALADVKREHDAARARESAGAAASETEREREALRGELERASRRCQELSAALDAKTAELQALPGKAVLEAAKRDRDEARSALATALAERESAVASLEAAADERDSADAALRQAEAERDEARTALAEAASESEAAHAAMAEHEQRAEELRSRLDQAEAVAAERAAEVEAATREAAEQRERVAAGFLETEALARERARVSELEAQIAALTGELEGALARAAEHAPAKHRPARERHDAQRLRPFLPGLDDARGPRAHIGLDGRFTALNDGFCELVGYSEPEFSGVYWPPVVDAKHRNDLRRATARVIAGELPSCEVDTVYMAGNGTLVRVVGAIRLERDPSGSARHLVLDAEPASVVAA